MRSRLVLRVIVGVATLGASVIGVCAAGGCNILGPAIVLIQGPPKTERLYELDPKLRTVVFVDDSNNRLPFTTLRRTIAERAEQQILKKKLVEPEFMISTTGVIAAASADRFGEAQSVVAIGRSVNAQRVIYASVDDFRLTNDGQSLAPTCKMRVRIVDCDADEVVWPPDKEGHMLTVALKWRSGNMPGSSTEALPIYRELAEQSGLGIAQMFYTFETSMGAGVAK